MGCKEDGILETLNIQTARTHIRQLEFKDLFDFHLYRSNPEVTKYQSFDPMTLDEAKDFILDNSKNQFGMADEWVQFGIENRYTGKLIGDCAIKLNHDNPQMAEIGITISNFEQKKGYAKEVLTGILKFLFEKYKIHRIFTIVDTENIASINLLKSIGFRQEGHFIENVFLKGKWVSEFQFAMLKREWEDLKGQL